MYKRRVFLFGENKITYQNYIPQWCTFQCLDSKKAQKDEKEFSKRNSKKCRPA